ncbi:hypothetical protein DFH08DRAFT_1001797 [Mycena albidolilacea]|uniref:Zn(2)-C6 fungal-type domain-containing protein n=1 Tax=Mycena albidolilacea TaxID=1033008 RepID=A0AAD6YW43_9AGAR|nr:hypothetical protein DFH08DRAFT_1001797 [Mycena albidolilacea]
MPPRTRRSGTKRVLASPESDSMPKPKTRSKRKATSPASTAADDTLPKCLVPGWTILATAPGALTWLNFDNYDCRQLCRLFDATEAAQMEERLIMSIRDFRTRFPETTAEKDRFLWSVYVAAIPLAQRFPSAFADQPSVAPSEEDPFPVDPFYCTPLLEVRPSKARRAFVNASAFSSDFQIPHVELVPVSYALYDSDDGEEEADREVGKEGEAEGSTSEHESGALRTGSSALSTRKTQPAPSSPTKSEGALSSPSASTSKPGTIFVKKDGGSSSKTPKTPAKQERPKPKGAYRGAKLATPPAADLFDDEARASSSKTTADNRPVYSLSSQGRPPSEDVVEFKKPSTKRVRTPSPQTSRKSAKTRAEANPPAGERDKPNPRHVDAPLGLEVVPHNSVVEFTTPALPHRCSIACATCIARGKTCARDGFGTPCDHCSNENQACSFKRSPMDFHRTLEFLRPLVSLGGGALSSAVLSAVQARRDLNKHFLWLARAAHNYDRLCTEVVVLFRRQRELLPEAHLEEMFEDPDDIQLLNDLEARSLQHASAAELELLYQQDHPRSAPPAGKPALHYFTRSNPDHADIPSDLHQVPGVQDLSHGIFANPSGASLSEIARAPSPDAKIVVPKQEPPSVSVQGTSHVRFDDVLPIATMPEAPASPPRPVATSSAGNPVAPHTPVGSRQPSIRKFFTPTPVHKRVRGDVQPMEGVVGGEGSHAASG